jgi:Restriction endonuclease BglII
MNGATPLASFPLHITRNGTTSWLACAHSSLSGAKCSKEVAKKSVISRRIDSFLEARGWKEKKFLTAIRVDEKERASPTHKVDCFKECVGLEIEWNNKDPFFDRDLNNFRLLFELRVIDVGVIITRASHLQAIFKSLGKKVASKYGASTIKQMENIAQRGEPINTTARDTSQPNRQAEAPECEPGLRVGVCSP